MVASDAFLSGRLVGIARPPPNPAWRYEFHDLAEAYGRNAKTPAPSSSGGEIGWRGGRFMRQNWCQYVGDD